MVAHFIAGLSWLVDRVFAHSARGMSHELLLFRACDWCGLSWLVVANDADWPPLVGICTSIQKACLKIYPMKFYTRQESGMFLGGVFRFTKKMFSE